jgi:cell division protease FtsH
MADTEYDDAWSEFIDEDGKVTIPKRKPIEKDDQPDPQKILPQLMLEDSLSKAELREIDTRDAYCLLIQVPGPDWTGPLYYEVKARSDWNDCLARTTPHRGKSGDDAARPLTKALADGGRIFGIAHTLSILPEVMVSSADRILVLPFPSPALLGKAIKKVTGKLPVHLPENLGAGLGFDELVSCLRPGSTAAECVDRMKQAMSRKRGIDDAGVPTLDQLHGYGAAMVWCQDLVADFDSWRRGEIPWSALSAAVVWTSEPGLGKTSLARSLSKSLGVPLIATSVAQWFSQGSGYLDSIIKQIDEVFARARTQAPCVLLLDEIDAVPSRIRLDSRNADYWSVVITHMLTLLDGAVAGQTEGIVLVGATNHGSRLDPALVREGRFDRLIHIDPPDETALAGIFRQHLCGDLAGEDLSGAARLALGRTGAAVVDFVKSARRAARTAKRPMSMADLMNAIAPPDDRPGDLVERIAIHEAGHAIIAHALGVGKIVAVSIVQEGTAGGYVMTENEERSPRRKDIEHAVIQTLAGRAAEHAILGDFSMGFAGSERSDLARATRLIGTLHLNGMGEHFHYQGSPEEVHQVLLMKPVIAAAVDAEMRQLYADAMRLVRIHADAIVAVAEELMVHRQLNAAQFHAAIERVKAPRVWPQVEGSTHG